MMMPNRPRQSATKTIFLGFLSAAIAAALGQFAFKHIPTNLLINALSFSITVVGIVWVVSLLIYNKLSDVTDIAGLSYQEHRLLETAVHARLNHFWLRAVFLGAIAFGMYLPKLMHESGIELPTYLFSFSFACFALGLYSFHGLWRELEEIRSLKSYAKEIERREAARKNQLTELASGLTDGWNPDSKLDGFRDSKQN